MPITADAVVVVGGIMGAATTYFLTELGFGKVILLERGSLGQGSTGKSAAIVRQHYSNEVTARAALRGVEIFENFSGLFGVPGVFC